jgi:Carboxypeptidase regulatory-like domain/TonB dependent receptor
MRTTACKRLFNSSLTLIATLIAVFTPLRAQVGTASLGGVVTDASGASVPNAAISLKSVLQKYTRETVTSPSGEYTIPALPPGDYELVVTASGFQTSTKTNIRLSSGQASELDVQLTVAGANEQITVSEAPPLLQTANATLGTTLPARHVSELPILGRSFLNLMFLTPGTAPVPPAGSTTNYSPVGQSLMPSVYGQRQKDNNFTMDGVENRDPNLLGVPLFPPPEAIAEMKVESGASSGVYGHGSGATVNLVTKSGTNQWHGDGWEFIRNNVLDARSFFLPSIGAFRWNQFGGAVGGPLAIPHLISKEKGWYVFGYYEGVRIHQASNFRGFVPTAAELSGNFAGDPPIYNPFTTAPGPNGGQVRQPFPNNQIPANLINPSMQLIATTLYPAPNLPPNLIPGVNFLNTSPSVTDGDQWSARVDHQFGHKDSFFARYSDTRNPSHGVGLPSITSQALSRLTNVVGSDTHTFTPTFLITGRFGMSRINNQSFVSLIPGLAQKAGTLAAFPPFHGDESIPPLGIPGFSGLSQERAIIGPLYQNSWTADGQKIKGAHTFEFGGGIVHTKIDVDNRTASVSFSPNQTSNFVANTGFGLASFLLGAPESASRNAGNTEGLMHGNTYSWYLQDTWRASRKLTLNLGLRWDYASPLINDFGLATFVFETGQYVWDKKNPITGAAPNIPPAGIPPDRNNFAPRAGIAYQITPTTVLRSGFGIFYNTFGSNYVQAQQSARGNWPFAFPQSLTGLNTGVPNVLMPDPFPGPAIGSTVPLGCQQCLNIIESSSRTSYVEEWSFSIQQQMSRSWLVEAAYFGSHGVKLTGQIVDNTAVIPGPGPIAARQIRPQFPPYINNGYNEFPSWYDGVSLKLEKRLSHGLSFLVSYTFSKTIDISDNLSNASLGGNPTSNATRFNIPQNKGVAGFDIPQNFVTSVVYALPGKTKNRALDAVVSGWNASGIFSHYSGLPFMTFLTSDVANIGTVSGRVTQYPNIVGDPNAVSQRSPQQWFNTAAFAQPPQYTFGNAGRNILRTDTLNNIDFSVYKRWPFRETRHIELRGEFFNLMNHPSFGYPGVSLGTAQFGKISNTRNSGRQIQLAFKVHF